VTPCGVFGWSDEDWETDVEPTAVGGIGKRFATGVGRFRIGGGPPGQLVSFRESRRADSNRGPLHYE
jgi:hypothetical protein